MPLTTISPSLQVRPVNPTAHACAGRSGSVTHARIVPPASHKHGPHTCGAAVGPDLTIAADGAEEGNV
jgi:hypothetical protein